MKLHTEDIISWYDTMDDIKEYGFIPVQVTSLLFFFRLKGRTGIISTENIEPLLPIKYVLFSPAENRYYLKQYKGYGLKDMYDNIFSGDDIFLNNLLMYIENKHIYLMFDKAGITDMTAMLTRIWNAKFTEKGKLNYSDYIKLVKEITDYEYYQSYGKNLTGYKTVSNQLQLSIDELWNNAFKAKR